MKSMSRLEKASSKTNASRHQNGTLWTTGSNCYLRHDLRLLNTKVFKFDIFRALNIQFWTSSDRYFIHKNEQSFVMGFAFKHSQHFFWMTSNARWFMFRRAFWTIQKHFWLVRVVLHHFSIAGNEAHHLFWFLCCDHMKILENLSICASLRAFDRVIFLQVLKLSTMIVII